MREKLPIIVIHNEVDSNNICNIYIDEIIHPKNYTNESDLTNRLLKIYEKIILNKPEQWYWFQDRWTNKKIRGIIAVCVTQVNGGDSKSFPPSFNK